MSASVIQLTPLSPQGLPSLTLPDPISPRVNRFALPWLHSGEPHSPRSAAWGDHLWRRPLPLTLPVEQPPDVTGLGARVRLGLAEDPRVGCLDAGLDQEARGDPPLVVVDVDIWRVVAQRRREAGQRVRTVVGAVRREDRDLLHGDHVRIAEEVVDRLDDLVGLGVVLGLGDGVAVIDRVRREVVLDVEGRDPERVRGLGRRVRRGRTSGWRRCR